MVHHRRREAAPGRLGRPGQTGPVGIGALCRPAAASSPSRSRQPQASSANRPPVQTVQRTPCAVWTVGAADAASGLAGQVGMRVAGPGLAGWDGMGAGRNYRSDRTRRQRAGPGRGRIRASKPADNRTGAGPGLSREGAARRPVPCYPSVQRITLPPPSLIVAHAPPPTPHPIPPAVPVPDYSHGQAHSQSPPPSVPDWRVRARAHSYPQATRNIRARLASR